MSELDLGTTINVNEDDSLKQVIKDVFEGLKDVKDSYLASIKENREKFEQFISPGKKIAANAPSFLSILRKWNSYTPVLPTRRDHPKGGGYFIYHNGVGIVIDPGFNFIQNFFNNNFKLDDIDVVLITHAHNDHTVELESLFSLLYKRNRKKPVAELKKIDIYLNLGSFKKFAAFFDLSHKDYPNYIRNIVLLDSHNEYAIPKNNMDADVSIITTKTQHHEMITSSYALGFILKCGEKTLRFTSDTGWNPDIEALNERYMSAKQVDKIDILIPHLGSIEDSEFKFDFAKSINENISNEIFYEQHLGILGCVCMISKYRPEMVIFSEFGEELKAIRKDVVSKMSEAMQILAFPGDIGLHVRLNDLAIYCSKNGTFEPKEDIRVYEVADDLLYVSETSFSIGEQANKQQAVETVERKLLIN